MAPAPTPTQSDDGSSEFPECGKECLDSAASASNCGSTNFVCQCTSKDFFPNFTACIAKACNDTTTQTELIDATADICTSGAAEAETSGEDVWILPAESGTEQPLSTGATVGVSVLGGILFALAFVGIVMCIKQRRRLSRERRGMAPVDDGGPEKIKLDRDLNLIPVEEPPNTTMFREGG